MLIRQRTADGAMHRASGSMASEARSEAFQCYMYLILPVIGFLVLNVYPILWSMKWSLYFYNMTPSATRFVGLTNFIRMFTEDFTYWRMWGNTILFALLKIPLETVLALLIALMLSSSVIRGKSFFRTVYFMPTVIGSVIVGLVFSNMYSYFGVVNECLMKLGIIHEPIDWLASRSGAYFMLVVSSIWRSFGVNVMYFIAALANVPEELYESARLDGAGKMTTFFKITMPSIVPVFRVIMLLSILGTLSINEEVIVLTNGAPNGSTHTVMSYLTTKFMPGFTGETPALGYGSAMSLVTTVIFVFIGILYNKVSSGKKD